MFRYLAEPRNILAEPLGSAEPRLKNTGLDKKLKTPIWGMPTRTPSGYATVSFQWQNFERVSCKQNHLNRNFLKEV